MSMVVIVHTSTCIHVHISQLFCRYIFCNYVCRLEMCFHAAIFVPNSTESKICAFLYYYSIVRVGQC